MKVLDDLVMSNLKDRLFVPERVAALLEALLTQRAARQASVDRRALALQSVIADAEERLNRIYRSIEDGVVEPDDMLRERIQRLQDERARSRAALERIHATSIFPRGVNAESIEAFSRLIQDKLDNGDINTKKRYIRSVVGGIEVDDGAIRIIGSRAVLEDPPR